MKSFLREIYHSFTGLKTPSEWDPYTKLLIKSSNSDWVLDTIRTEMLEVCSTIGVPVIDKRYAHKLTNQSIFYTSKYEALDVVKTTKNTLVCTSQKCRKNMFFLRHQAKSTNKKLVVKGNCKYVLNKWRIALHFCQIPDGATANTASRTLRSRPHPSSNAPFQQNDISTHS